MKTAKSVKVRSGAHTPQQVGDPFAQLKVNEDAL